MSIVINELEHKMVTDFLDDYLEHIKADYRNRFRKSISEGIGNVAQEMIQEFEASVSVQVGSKYMKVVAGNSVHSFICYRDLGKFTKGDILKAASWRSPAKNFARGNIMSKDFSRITWTGAQ